MAYYSLYSNQGAWSNVIQYSILTIRGQADTGLFYQSVPVVFYNGGQYIANGSVQPTLGTTPDVDPGWTLINTSGYAFSPNITSVGLSNGNIPMGSFYSSANITYNSSTKVINLPNNATFLATSNLWVTSNSTGTCTISITVTNATVSINTNTIASNLTNSDIILMDARIVTNSTGSPTVALTVSGYTGNVTIPTNSNFKLQSI